jgi:alkyl sulfatase BDS1-like metallo-beta-lactamase superfamily hydrolase
MPYVPKGPEPATIAANREAVALYDLEDRRDFADADRGFIAGLSGPLLSAAGTVMFDPADYDFLRDGARVPDSVNPSLWRQSQIIFKGGLYKVTDRLYQVRNNNIANLTVVEGDRGLVVIDCTGAVESAGAAMTMIREHVSDKPVVGVIYTHTHVDHYGGVKGVVDQADVASGQVPVIAPGTPKSFSEHAIGENVVGNAMSRRASYTFGSLLDHGPRAMITCGIGVASAPGRTVSYIAPVDGITETGTKRDLAGLTFEFLYAPDTEAPEEMHIWIPQLRALTCAENANHSLHNIQSLRGARTRDARNFARCLDETLQRWGSEAEVYFGLHTWPVWGNDQITAFIESQRDTYKYIHDQALRLANKGYSPLEAAEVIELPDELGRKWFNRDYHGTLHHDVRAVFTKELGTWDGDPVSLHPHTPVDSAHRYVELIGAEAIMAEGRKAVSEGDYRWAAQVLHHLVFAQPGNQAARDLQADAYEQLGYQAEGPQWRGIYLTAARELREGVLPARFATASPDAIEAMPVELLFDYAAVHLIGDEAAKVDLRINFTFTDMRETWAMSIRHGVLNARRGADADAQLTVSGPKAGLTGVLLHPRTAKNLAGTRTISLFGDQSVLETYAGLLEKFDPDFAIVTP